MPPEGDPMVALRRQQALELLAPLLQKAMRPLLDEQVGLPRGHFQRATLAGKWWTGWGDCRWYSGKARLWPEYGIGHFLLHCVHVSQSYRFAPLCVRYCRCP